MSQIDQDSQGVKGAIDAYVKALNTNSEDSSLVVRAMNDLHRAISSFTETSIREFGWGNAFSPPKEEVEEKGRRNAPGTVKIEASYEIRVTNPFTFRQVVLDRALKTGSIVHADLDTPTSLVHEIFAIDGWNPYRYRGADIEVLCSKWIVRPQ